MADFQLDLTREIKAWILSFGRHAEVLGPEELRREMGEELGEMAARYGKRAATAVGPGRRMDIRQAIDGLPRRERIVMRRHYVDGVSPDDIAEALGMREATVCRTLSRGRAHLRETYLISCSD